MFENNNRACGEMCDMYVVDHLIKLWGMPPQSILEKKTWYTTHPFFTGFEWIGNNLQAALAILWPACQPLDYTTLFNLWYTVNSY